MISAFFDMSLLKRQNKVPFKDWIVKNNNGITDKKKNPYVLTVFS